MRPHRHLVVIGAQRCGTTLVSQLLEAHPDVASAQPARPEPKVFCDEERSARGHEWYDATWFGHAGDRPLLAEKSTSYLEDPLAAARAERVLGPDTLALVQLRDPVQRAVSHWAFSTDNGLEERPLADALIEDLRAARSGGDGRAWDRGSVSVSPYAYVRRGQYADHLVTWLQVFGDRLVVSFLEDLATGHSAILDSLGLDPARAADGPVGRVNASSAAAELDPALAEELRAHYAEPDARLAAMLGRPLPWRTS